MPAPLTSLIGHISGTAPGTGSLLVISGPTGSGKTRLVRDALAAVRGFDGVHVAALPWLADDPGSLFRHLRERLGGAPASVLDVPGASTVLAIDSAQWADEESLREIVSLVKRVTAGRLVVVLTLGDTATGEETPFSATVTGLADAAIELSPLTLAQVRELVTREVGARLSHTRVRQLRDATDGRPGRIADVLRAAPADHWLSPDPSIPIPKSWTTALDRRLRTLPHGALPALEALAIFPGSGPVDIVRELAGTVDAGDGDAELDGGAGDFLDAAVAAGVARLWPEPGNTTIGFADPSFREVMSSRMGPRRRAELHARAAAGFRDRGDDVSALRHEALAADGPDAAVADKLAGHALSSAMAGRWRDAAAHYRLAADLSGETGTRRHHELMSIEALISASDIPEARMHLRTMPAAAGTHTNTGTGIGIGIGTPTDTDSGTGTPTDTDSGIGTPADTGAQVREGAREHPSESTTGHSALRRAASPDPATGNGPAVDDVRMDAIVGYLALHEGRRAEATARIGAAADYALADEGMDPEARVRVATKRTLLAMVDWRPGEVVEWADRARRWSEPLMGAFAEASAMAIIGEAAQTGIRPVDKPIRGEQPLHEQRRLMAHGWAALVHDDPVRARELLAATSPAEGSERVSMWMDAWRARAEFILGEWPDAMRTVERGLARAERFGVPIMEPLLLWTGAQIAAYRGDHGLARDYLNRAVIGPDSFPIQIIPSLMGRVVVSSIQSDVPAAVRAGDSLNALAANLDISQPGFWPWEDVYALALLRAGRNDDADAVTAAGEARADGSGIRSLSAKLAIPRAGILIQRGDIDTAMELLEEATESIMALPIPAYQGRILYEYGQHLRRLGRRKIADDVLARAADVFAGMGATEFVERCNRERRAAGMASRRRVPGDGAGGMGAGGMSGVGGIGIGGMSGAGGAGGPGGTARRGAAMGGHGGPGAGGALAQLTPQESEIAEIIASGASNREAARELYLSPKTVEYHLTRIYRKLGIRSRSELPQVMRGR